MPLHGGIILFCCIYPPHLKGRSVKILADIKPVRGAKKVGDRCSSEQIGRSCCTCSHYSCILSFYLRFAFFLATMALNYIKKKTCARSGV